MKNDLMSKMPRLMISVLVLVFAMISCSKETYTPMDIEHQKDMRSVTTNGKRVTTGAVALIMTVSDASGNKITSDGNVTYENGTDNVRVEFDQYGNFMFGQASSNRRVPPMTRFLNINFDSPETGYSSYGSHKSNFISTITTSTSPNPTLLQNLATGETKCIGLSAGISTIEGGVLNFHRNAEDNATSPTAYVYVTKINATQWVMTPVPPASGGCSPISNVGALRINGALSGYYNMPFSFTLTKK
jgi:hypothetical protein